MKEDNTELKPWQEGIRFGVIMFVLMGIVTPLIDNQALVLKQVLFAFLFWLIVGLSWVFIAPKMKAIDKKRELAAAAKNPSLVEDEDIVLEWWKEGLTFALILFVLVGILLPLITFQGLVLKKILIGIPLFIIVGLWHGWMVYFFRESNKKRVEE